MNKRGRPPKQKTDEEVKQVDNVLLINKLTNKVIAKTEVRALASITTAKERRMIRAIIEVIVDMVK